MEDTPTGRGIDLFTVLGNFQNGPQSRSVNNFCQPLDLDPNSRTYVFLQVKAPPSHALKLLDIQLVSSLLFEQLFE